MTSLTGIHSSDTTYGSKEGDLFIPPSTTVVSVLQEEDKEKRKKNSHAS